MPLFLEYIHETTGMLEDDERYVIFRYGNQSSDEHAAGRQDWGMVMVKTLPAPGALATATVP